MTFIPPLVSEVSPDNSSTTPLSAGAVFTGIGKTSLASSRIAVNVFTDQQGTLSIQQSTDNSNWDITNNHIVREELSTCEDMETCGSFFRVVFTNTSLVAQTILRLQTTTKPPGNESFGPLTTIGFLDNLKDAFGRLRVSTPETLLDAKMVDTSLPHLFAEIVTGSGATVFVAGRPQLELNVDGNVIGRVVRQTRRYVNYQPGKSLLFYLTGTFMSDPSVGGVTSRIGVFDNKADKTVDAQPTGDGFFFECIGGATPVTSIVYRTSNNALFTQTDTKITQADWNTDPFDGSGPSGFELDPTVRNVMWLDQEWLGSGSVRLGFVFSGTPLVAHEFFFANNSNTAVAYTSRPSLPIRYEIESLGTGAATTVSTTQICSTGIVEGNFTALRNVFSASRLFDTVSVGATEIPVISLRLKASRNRYTLSPLSATILNTSAAQSMLTQVYRFISPSGGSPLTGAVWTTNAGLVESAGEFDITASAIDLTGVTFPYERVWSGYLSTRETIDLSEIKNQFTVEADIAGNSDMVILTMIASGGNSDIAAGIVWQEFS